MNVHPDAQVSLPAGEGDLAVAAAFAAGADDSAFGARPPAGAPAGAPAGDRSDTDSDADSDADAPPSGAPAEFEFSDEETRRRIPGVIRDGSDSSEWSDSSDDEDVEELDLENMPKWLEDIKNGVKSDFDDDAAHSEPPRTKNEIAADAVPPPPPPPPVRPDEAIAPLGDVVSVVGDTIVVQSLPGSDPIDEESVLCLESRLGLGAVEEVFGPVAAPLYALRLPGKAKKTTAPTEGREGEGAAEGAAGDAAVPAAAEEEDPAVIVAREVRVGTRVFVVEGRRRALETKGLHTKGYDNSGQNDEEVAEDDEFSDDEKEAEAKKKRRQKKRGANGEAVEVGRGSTRDGGLAAAAAAPPHASHPA